MTEKIELVLKLWFLVGIIGVFKILWIENKSGIRDYGYKDFLILTLILLTGPYTFFFYKK